MKKNLLTAFVCSLGLAGFSQTVLFSEDFESGIMPASFILHDEDGLTNATNVSQYNSTWIVTDDFSGSNNVAGSSSWFSPAGQADDWMVIPGIEILNSNTYLTWDSKAQDASYPDGYSVYISTTGTNPGDFTTQVFSVAQDAATWGTHSADLSAFVGDTVNIAFRNNSTDMFILFVDNITVAEYSTADIALTALDGQKVGVMGNNIDVKGSVTNYGTSPITSFDVVWTDGGLPNTHTVTGVNIGFLETYDFTHGDVFTIPGVGEHNITVGVNLTGDTDLSNNGGSMTVLGAAFTPNKVVFGEEATGTWCGWCPRGAVYMDYMEDTYGDQWIGVAVHNSDPMVVSAYDTWIGSQIGGYPSGLVNRDGNEYDPSAFPAAFDDMIDDFGHADISVDATLDANDMIQVEITAHFAVSSSTMDYRLAGVVIENNLTGTSSEWAQTNYYSGGAQGAMGGYENLGDPVPAADMVYDHVGRALLGGTAGDAGSVPAIVTAGDSVVYTYSIAKDSDWDISELSIAAILLDNATGEVLNAGEKHHVDYSYEEDGVTYEVVDGDTFEYWDGGLVPLGTEQATIADFSFYPNPASNMINFEGVSGITNVIVRDAQGRVVMSTTAEGKVLNIEALSAGFYTMTIENEGKVASAKLTVLK